MCLQCSLGVHYNYKEDCLVMILHDDIVNSESGSHDSR